MASNKTREIALPRLGITNAAGDTNLQKGQVLDAANVDIHTDGVFRRRASPSTTALVDLPNVHTMFWFAQANLLLMMQDTKLYADGGASGAYLLGDLGSRDVHFVEYTGYLCIAAEGIPLWFLRPDLTLFQGTMPLDAVPICSPTDVGALPPGVYHIMFTLFGNARESPPSSQQRVVLTDTGGINISMAGVTIPPYHHIIVYMTEADGEVLRHGAALFTSADTTIHQHMRGQICQQTGMKIMYGGHLIEWAAARLFVARGDALFYSVQFASYLTKAAYDFIQFVGKISLLQRAGDKLFVGDDRGVWVLDANAPESTTLSLASVVLPFLGSGTQVAMALLPFWDDNNRPKDDSVAALWLTEKGAYVGMPDGGIKAIHSSLELNRGTIVEHTARASSGGTPQVIFSTDQRVL